MLFQDHPMFNPNGPLWKKIGPPTCPLCLAELAKDQEVKEVDDGMFGGILCHTVCFNMLDQGQDPFQARMDPDLQVVDWMSDPTAWELPQGVLKKPAGFVTATGPWNGNKHERIEIPTWVEIDGEWVQSGSVTISKKQFHDTIPQGYAPSEVPDSLEGWCNEGHGEGSESESEEKEEGV